GMELNTWMASSCDEAISAGLAMGPPACSRRSLARPSQNWAILRLALSTVGELMPPCCQLWPMEAFRLSEPPMLRLWHELHEMAPDLDRRGSKNSFLPSSTLAGSVTTAGSMGWMGSCCCAGAGCAHNPAMAATAHSMRGLLILLS